MENILIKLFDYQRIVNNRRLAALISDTQSRCKTALSDDDLLLVNAAGEPIPPKKPKSEKGECDD